MDLWPNLAFDCRFSLFQGLVPRVRDPTEQAATSGGRRQTSRAPEAVPTSDHGIETRVPVRTVFPEA